MTWICFSCFSTVDCFLNFELFSSSLCVVLFFCCLWLYFGFDHVFGFFVVAIIADRIIYQ